MKAHECLSEGFRTLKARIGENGDVAVSWNTTPTIRQLGNRVLAY